MLITTRCHIMRWTKAPEWTFRWSQPQSTERAHMEAIFMCFSSVSDETHRDCHWSAHNVRVEHRLSTILYVELFWEKLRSRDQQRWRGRQWTNRDRCGCSFQERQLFWIFLRGVFVWTKSGYLSGGLSGVWCSDGSSVGSFLFQHRPVKRVVVLVVQSAE